MIRIQAIAIKGFQNFEKDAYYVGMREGRAETIRCMEVDGMDSVFYCTIRNACSCAFMFDWIMDMPKIN